MIRPTSFGKVYRPIPQNNNKPVQAASSTFSTMRIQPVTTSAVQPASDQLQISPQCSFQRTLAETTAAIGRETAATVSPQRLEDLKQQIAQGTYQVSAADLADAILSRAVLTRGAC